MSSISKPAVTVELYHESYSSDKNNIFMQQFPNGSQCALAPWQASNIDAQNSRIQKCARVLAETIQNAPENQRSSPQELVKLVQKSLSRDNGFNAEEQMPPLKITVGNKTAKFEFDLVNYNSSSRESSYTYREIKWYNSSSLGRYSHTTKIEISE